MKPTMQPTTQRPPLLQTVVDEFKAETRNPDSSVYAQMETWLINILRENERYRLEVVKDGYDCKLCAFPTSEEYCLEQYPDVATFLDNEPSGDTMALYLSQTASQELWSALIHWQRNRLPHLYDDEEAFLREHGFDENELCDAVCAEEIEGVFYETFGKQTLTEVWNKHLPVTYTATC